MNFIRVYLLLSLASVVPAKADILFFDFNGATAEKAAAARAAKARGEKLIVLPATAQKDLDEVAKIRKEYNAQMKAYKKSCGNSPQTPSCKEQLNQSQMTVKRMDYAKSKISMSPSSVEKSIKELAEQKVEISSMVISGHDGNGAFNGDNGTMTAKRFGKIAKNNPEVFKNLRGLMLWGCYTTNAGSVLGKWKDAFPNVELIAGFDGRAPLASSPSSSTYLEDVLKKEKNLAQIKDRAELQKQFKQLKDITNVHGALCSGELFVSNKGVLDQASLKKMCEDMPTQKWSDRITCFQVGLKGCENVPTDTARGEIRQIYEAVQAVSHCQNLHPEQAKDIPNAKTLLRLLFFEEVKKNFLANQSEDITQLNELLEKLEAPADLMLPDFSTLSRAELVKKLTDIDNFLTTKSQSTEGAGEGLLATSAAEAQVHAKNMAMTLSDLAEECVPFSWVEPRSNEKSVCRALPGSVQRHHLAAPSAE